MTGIFAIVTIILTIVLSKISHRVQYINQVKFSIKTEEIKALIDCYESYFKWINIVLGASSSKVTEDSYPDTRDIDKAFSKFEISYRNLQLWFSHEETLIKTISELKKGFWILKALSPISWESYI